MKNSRIRWDRARRNNQREQQGSAVSSLWLDRSARKQLELVSSVLVRGQAAVRRIEGIRSIFAGPVREIEERGELGALGA